MKLDHLSRPVRHVYVCPNNHIGPVGHKTRSDQVKRQPCLQCDEIAELKPVSVSRKTRRRKGFKAAPEHREAPEPVGPRIDSEPFPLWTDPESGEEERFELSERQLAEFVNGEVPTIAFPLSGMPPLLIGHIYAATDDVSILITGYRETTTHLVAQFEIHRSAQTVREDGIQIERKATRRAAYTDPKTGTYHEAEPEAERLRRAEASAMTREVKLRQLEQQKKDHEMAEAFARDLENRYAKHECWPARQQVNRLHDRVLGTEEAIRELDKSIRRAAA